MHRYVLNLIDTPGHVDFAYEVSRSLQACEGALLVVDASQGVEAQTIANVFLAIEQDLEILPVLNKIDLPGADPDRVAEEVENVIGLDCSEVSLDLASNALDLKNSAANIGMCTRLDSASSTQIAGYSLLSENGPWHCRDPRADCAEGAVPAPADTRDKPLRALIFDSYYDPYRGVVVFMRIVDGELRKGDKIRFSASGAQYDALEVGVLTANGQEPRACLRAGEVGYMHGGIKSVDDARVGDTVTIAAYKVLATVCRQAACARLGARLWPRLGGGHRATRRAYIDLALLILHDLYALSRRMAPVRHLQSLSRATVSPCQWCTVAYSQSKQPSISSSATPSKS
eukprot:scaffold306396_cov33-Tisochrysis_lutea.AAC.2